MNQKMADFLMKSALKDMGIEAEMKEMAIVKKEPTATSILLTYRELYQFPPFLLDKAPMEEHIPFAKKLKRW